MSQSYTASDIEVLTGLEPVLEHIHAHLLDGALEPRDVGRSQAETARRLAKERQDRGQIVPLRRDADAGDLLVGHRRRIHLSAPSQRRACGSEDNTRALQRRSPGSWPRAR